jgi:hypothetical protein
MKAETRAAWRRVGHEQQKLGQLGGPGFYARLVDAALSVFEEYLKDVERICWEVWEAQGGPVTSEFVRTVVRDYAVFTAIEERCATLRGELEWIVRLKRFTQMTPVLRQLAREKGHLQSKLSNRYEIKAREIELKNAHHVPQAPPPAPDSGRTRPSVADPFTHFDDYRSVTVRGETHKLTSQQAQMVGILHRARKNRNPDVSISSIQEQLGKNSARGSSRWHDTWKSNPKAKKALITSGERKGTLRLKI